MQILGWVFDISDSKLKPYVLTSSIIFFIFSFIWIFKKIRLSLSKYTHDFDIVYFKRSDLDGLYKLSKELLPSVPTKRQIKNVFNANKKVFKMVVEKRKLFGHEIKKYVGFYSILPMTGEARSLLEVEQIRGIDFDSNHIEPISGSCECIYLGAIGAHGTRAKAHAVGSLKEKIHLLFESETQIIFTRPTTKDGLRSAKNFGFVPVNENVRENELERLYVLRKDDIHID